MASSSNPSTQATNQQLARQKKSVPFKFLIPLIYAPILPLIRITLRHKPVLRDRLFYSVLAFGFAHGAFMLTDIYNVESK